MPDALEPLLYLDGCILDQGAGYWIKIDAQRVASTEGRPFGIKYSLSLHEPSGRRIFGIDNAHRLPRTAGKRHRAKSVRFDHMHRFAGDVGVVYEFVDAGQLLEDFFAAADKVLLSKRGF